VTYGVLYITLGGHVMTRGVPCAGCCRVLQCVAVSCSMLCIRSGFQCVAVSCRELQCVAVCCSELQYVVY